MKVETQKYRALIFLSLFWTLLALIFGAINNFTVDDKNNPVAAFLIYFSSLIKFYLWAAFSPLIFLITKKFPFDRREDIHISFIIHIVTCVFLAGIHTNVFGLIDIILTGFSINKPDSANLFEDSFFIGHFFLGILLYTLIVVIVQSYLFFVKQQQEEMRNAKMQTELANAQLQALKMQLQPHFLFNALHSISSLNTIDPPKANKMIVRLGEFLRLTLEASEEQKVTLNEELNFLRYYLEIEQIRFSDRLKVEYKIADETLNAEVPHLILQPLVENAVKHGIAPFGNEGKIEIVSYNTGEKLFLEVRNSGGNISQKAETNTKSTGTGLKNIRLRLRQIYGENFRFELKENEIGGMTAEIEIPFSVETDAIILN